MSKFANFLDEITSISVKGVPAETIDALAVGLTAHLIDHDAYIAARFAEDVESPVYQPDTDHDLTPPVALAADYLAKDWGTAPDDTIKQLIAKCYVLAVLLARGEA